jgi:hypothetical protein
MKGWLGSVEVLNNTRQPEKAFITAFGALINKTVKRDVAEQLLLNL